MARGRPAALCRLGSLDHYGIEIDDATRKKLNDSSIPDIEKCQGVTHLVSESLVPGQKPQRIRIDFERFEDMGFSQADVGTDKCSFMVIGNIKILNPGPVPDIPAVGMHMARDTTAGCELRSRFWIGWQIEDGVPRCMAPRLLHLAKPFVKGMLTDTLRHNFFEFGNLAAILPELYAQESHS